jgi:hypothetical protein
MHRAACSSPHTLYFIHSRCSSIPTTTESSCVQLREEILQHQQDYSSHVAGVAELEQQRQILLQQGETIKASFVQSAIEEKRAHLDELQELIEDKTATLQRQSSGGANTVHTEKKFDQLVSAVLQLHKASEKFTTAANLKRSSEHNRQLHTLASRKADASLARAQQLQAW